MVRWNHFEFGLKFLEQVSWKWLHKSICYLCCLINMLHLKFVCYNSFTNKMNIYVFDSSIKDRTMRQASLCLNCHITKLVQGTWYGFLIREIRTIIIQKLYKPKLYTLLQYSIMPQGLFLWAPRDQIGTKVHTRPWYGSSIIRITAPIWIIVCP